MKTKGIFVNKKTDPFADFTNMDGIKDNGKPLMVYFNSTDPMHTSACQNFDRMVLNKAEVVELAKNSFNCLRVDVSVLEKKVRKKYKITRVPTVIFFDAKGKKIKTVAKTCTYQDFLKVMKYVVKKNEKAMEKK